MFIPAPFRIEVKPLKKENIILDTKDELVELGEIVSFGPQSQLGFGSGSDYKNYVYEVGDILAFEGWGCTKISYKGEDKWVVSTDKNVILGKFTKDAQ